MTNITFLMKPGHISAIIIGTITIVGVATIVVKFLRRHKGRD